jgi:hypothetical protein
MGTIGIMRFFGCDSGPLLRNVSIMLGVQPALSEDGRYLRSIAYGTNGNRLEAHPTLRRRVAALGAG